MRANSSAMWAIINQVIIFSILSTRLIVLAVICHSSLIMFRTSEFKTLRKAFSSLLSF